MVRINESCLDCVNLKLKIDRWGAYCSKTKPICREMDQFKKRTP